MVLSPEEVQRRSMSRSRKNSYLMLASERCNYFLFSPFLLNLDLDIEKVFGGKWGAVFKGELSDLMLNF
jgi:hypothetical protein